MSNSCNHEAKAFTRECVFLALINLLNEKKYEAITLTEIAEKAGVSRNAIYRNFRSKDLILKSYLANINSEFVSALSKKNISSHRDYIYAVFTHLCSHNEIAKILVKANLSTLLYESFLSVKGSFKVDDYIKNYYESYKIGGLFFVYITWLETGCNESPQELTEILCKIIESKPVIPAL
ncbi:MAG: TetR/AcrR family transcriptional regulator [Clostridia bacterium]|nr:TetR/AcrR family transcriptional regulator [Clostridia bacterium]